ncbi:peroxiredoxin-like family protein [Lacinutrix undariae]
MSTLKEQTDAKIAAGRKAKPEFMKGVDDVINQAKAFKKGENAIKVGETAPNFQLPNANKQQTSLATLLTKGTVIITFYRGSWCPYCNLQLKALQNKTSEFKALGATLVAISPQVPDGSLTKTEIDNLTFTVLSDQDAKVANQYGVAWKVPEFLMEHMRTDRNLDLDTINNGDGSILPIPATFIITSNGLVKWSYVNVDYRTRAEPNNIIEVLKSITQ